jgi:hypothetical protein
MRILHVWNVSLDQVMKTLKEVEGFLASSEGLKWISTSALHLRAFYLGLYFGLSQVADEADCKAVLVAMLGETFVMRSGDDRFGATSLGKELRALRERLERSIAADRFASSNTEGQTMAIQVEELLRHIDELDATWSDHRDVARHVLSRMNVKSLCELEANDAFLLDTPDSPFRTLALIDSICDARRRLTR